MILDSHLHLWRRARTPQPWIDPRTMAAIDRDFWVDDVHEAQTGTGVVGSVVVQSSNTMTETIDLLGAAAQPDRRLAGVVGWLDLQDDVKAQLSALTAGPGGDRLVGIRHLVHQDPDPRWLLRADVQHGFEALSEAGLVFDVVVRPEQLASVAQVAASHPGLSFVLDHLGKPPVSTGDLTAWERDLRSVAAHENVRAKISGLVTEASWDHWSIKDLRPVMDPAFSLFGPDRLMFGSDWPVIDLAGGFSPWLNTAQELIDETYHEAVFVTTAATTYRLGLDDA